MVFLLININKTLVVRGELDLQNHFGYTKPVVLSIVICTIWYSGLNIRFL